MTKANCYNCDKLAELTKYDDMFENGHGQYDQGYHHGDLLCQKCIARFDKRINQMYEELAKEREYMENNYEY